MNAVRATVLLCLVGLPAYAEFHTVPAQKKAVNVESLLIPDRQNIVCFYSVNNSICRAFYPALQKLGGRPNLELHAIDVGTVQSATSKKYSITSVPYFKIYNLRGELVSEGAPAYNQVTGMMEQP